MLAFKAAGAEVLAISTDSPHVHQAWMEFALGKLAFPLASDMTHQVSRDYGVLLEEQGVAQRGLYVIDPKGVVRYEVVHDMEVGRSVDEVLRVLDALKSGGKTPAGWKSGEPNLVVGTPSKN